MYLILRKTVIHSLQAKQKRKEKRTNKVNLRQTTLKKRIFRKFSGNHKGADQKANICMLPLLSQLPLLMLPPLLLPLHYSIYNIEGKFGLNQKTLCACTWSKERIWRIDSVIQLELLENAKRVKTSDQKPICARHFWYFYHCEIYCYCCCLDCYFFCSYL